MSGPIREFGETPEQHRVAVRIANRMQKIARMIEKELTKAGADKDEVQFSLQVWSNGRMQYVSNAERATVRDAMVELVAKWDKEKEPGLPRLPLGGLEDE